MNNIKTKLYLMIATAMLLSSCGSLPDIVPQFPLPSVDKHALPNGVDIERANNLLNAGKRREAASAYFQASNNYRSPQRERLILQAAELAAIFKDSNLTQRYLAPINYKALNAENKSRFRFAQAQLAINDRNYREALRILPQRVNGLSDGLASKILNARMLSAQSSGDKLSLIQELILQEPTLKNDYEISLNHDRVWNHIKQMPLQKIDDGRKSINHPILKNWLELGYLSKKIRNDKEGLRQKVNTWKRRNPTHPGNSKINEIMKSATTATVTPYLGDAKPVKSGSSSNNNTSHIAVLLPLTGNLSGIGKTLLKGVQAAHKESASAVPLKVYNTSTSTITGLYQTAIDKGATFVIGPFSKTKLNRIAKFPLPVPTLGLNYIQGSGKQLYQFGLSPADEAIQLAEHVIGRGQRRVAIVTPNSAWGKRIQDALRSAVIERGGKVVTIENYANKALTYFPVIQSLGKRENEIDAVLMAGSPSQALKLYPALRERLSRIPIYASSHVFNGLANPQRDAPLGGLIFTEIPWVLELLRKNQAAATEFPRLFAMGMDAYSIANDFTQLNRFGSSFKGKTGKVKLENDGKFHRRLRLAQFKNGVPVPY